MLQFNVHIRLACIGSLLILVSACSKPETSAVDNGKAVAKVNTVTLGDKDLENFVPSGLSKEDSTAFVKEYISKWASDELFYQQALNYLSEEEQNINKETEEFKKDLISYRFQIKLINDKLDTVVSAQEIEDYYNANSQNFLLKSNILKVLYIKTPIGIPNFEKFKKLCYSTNPKDEEQLKNLCVQYANNYYMNDNTWLLFDDLKKEMSQLNEVPDYTLQKGKIFEFTDVASFYFLKILDVKSKNTLSPLNFEKNNIKNMLVNQRKQQLINAVKKDFFDKAKTNKELEIYN